MSDLQPKRRPGVRKTANPLVNDARVSIVMPAALLTAIKRAAFKADVYPARWMRERLAEALRKP